MRSLLVAAVIAVAVSGCAPTSMWTGSPGQPVPVAFDNPAFIPLANHEQVWEGVVEVMESYFKIEHESPVRIVGNTPIAGRLETYPKVGATIFEPWDSDSANAYERIESTLQSIRRRAIVQVIPAQTGGFWVDVAVFKELENVPQPEHATAGAATFRYDDSLTRVVNPDRSTGISQGWIPQGRDTALEQRILGQLQYRFSPMGRPMPL